MPTETPEPTDTPTPIPPTAMPTIIPPSPTPKGGFLLLPFHCDVSWWHIHSYFDLDPNEGSIRDYLGRTDRWGCVGDLWTNTDATCDGHQGVDFVLPEGTEIVNATTYCGIVEFAEDKGDRIGNVILIDHSACGLPFKTEYAHLRSMMVTAGERVEPGQVIGTARGDTDTHLGLYKARAAAGGYDLPVDPYKDVLDPNDVGYWTVENSPQCQQP